jgi:hypothetical protein
MVKVKAHKGQIEIYGMTVAVVNEKSLQIETLETYFDPHEMFRQIAPFGVVNRVTVPKITEESERARLAEYTENEKAADFHALEDELDARIRKGNQYIARGEGKVTASGAPIADRILANLLPLEQPGCAYITPRDDDATVLYRQYLTGQQEQLHSIPHD